ncbi:MAG: divalent metal cation transporter, partial [Planctomycetota bacterium]
EPTSSDDKIWAAIVTVLTAIMLVVGRYTLIQNFATFMVVAFSIVTVINLFLLQANETLGVTGQELTDGLKFKLPPETPTRSTKAAVDTALKTLGIIGVGASELVAYPYWCLEKGYAGFTGPREQTKEWADRARGWLRVLQWDAWCSAGIYTFATIAFYLVGAATLGRFNLIAEGTEMVRTLAVMYEPVFGSYAPTLFLFGAIAVLYSTFFVANASHARVSSDALRVFGFKVETEEKRRKLIKVFSAIFPFLCLSAYLFYPKPTTLVLLSGLMQALMLPMLAGAALFFRYRRGDDRLLPKTGWDLMLWISAVVMLIAGGALIYLKL